MIKLKFLIKLKIQILNLIIVNCLPAVAKATAFAGGKI